MMHTPVNLYHRVTCLNEQLEQFMRKTAISNNFDPDTASETFCLIELIKGHNAPDHEICSRLRANALRTDRFSPVITAHLELIAAEYDPRNPSNRSAFQ